MWFDRIGLNAVRAIGAHLVSAYGLDTYGRVQAPPNGAPGYC
jgi:hypothetical protein